MLQFEIQEKKTNRPVIVSTIVLHSLIMPCIIKRFVNGIHLLLISSALN